MPKLRDETVEPLHPFWWIGLPAIMLALGLLVPLLGFEIWHPLLASEWGLIEGGTVVLLVPAMVLSVRIFLRRRLLPRGIGWLMLAGGVAALYFAGEETSWGQHYVGFETPEGLARINEQKEFNLHNIAGFGNIFNNVPRQTMMAFCIIVCVILPLAVRRRFEWPRDRKSVWYWLIPSRQVAPVALLAAFSTTPEHIINAYWRPALKTYLSMAFTDNGGEFKEFHYALVMFLYLWVVYKRVRLARAEAERLPAGDAAPSAAPSLPAMPKAAMSGHRTSPE